MGRDNRYVLEGAYAGSKTPKRKKKPRGVVTYNPGDVEIGGKSPRGAVTYNPGDVEIISDKPKKKTKPKPKTRPKRKSKRLKDWESSMSRVEKKTMAKALRKRKTKKKKAENKIDFSRAWMND